MNIKRFTALALTAVLAATGFTGCSKNFESVVTVEDTAFSPSMYLCAQYQAYSAAWDEVSEGTEDLLSATIDDMSAEEWIHAETIKNLKVYAWVEKTFEEMGLKLDQEEIDYINYQIEYYWPYLEETYTNNGIGKETYSEFVTVNYKSNDIFAAIYENGEKAPTDDEYKAYMDEHYARVNGFYMPMANADGSEFDEKQEATVIDLCEAAVKELNEGADIAEVCGKYKSEAALITGDKNGYEEGSSYVTNMYVAKNSQAVSEVVSANAFVMEENGDFTYDVSNDQYFIYQRVPNFATDKELADLKKDLVGEMKGDEYTAYFEGEAEKIEVVENTAAVKYYSVKKIK